MAGRSALAGPVASCWLPQLDKRPGRPVRVLWQEVEVLQPGTRQYHKLRKITGLELP